GFKGNELREAAGHRQARPARERHGIGPGAGGPADRADQLADRPLPGAPEGPSWPSGAAQDGGPATPPAELSQADGARDLSRADRAARPAPLTGFARAGRPGESRRDAPPAMRSRHTKEQRRASD